MRRRRGRGDLRRNVIDGGAELLGCRGNGGEVVRAFLGAGRGARGTGLGLAHCLGHLIGGAAHAFGGLAEGAEGARH
jgi:hypothetical protein